MKLKNKYQKFSKITDPKFCQILRVDMGFAKYFRVHHGDNELARGTRHINGIESFWSYAKHRLIQFNGVAIHTFYLHLKETEFRFNHRHDDWYRVLLRMLRENPLK